MRRVCATTLLFVSLIAVPLGGVSPAWGYWIWTPRTGKWVNPKSQPKDSPQEQLEYALSLFEAHDETRAVRECLKLVRHYPKSSQAPDAQFYAGQCYELLHRPYQAFLMYKKLIEVYPYSARFKDAIARSFTIGESFYEGLKVRPLQPVPLGVAAYDKAVEIFEQIVAQAPYGEYGDRAQFRLGQTQRKLGDYGAAMKAFEKLVHEYPNSSLVEEARYNAAFCAKQLSLKPAYDQASTDQAITWFEEFLATHPNSELQEEATRSLQQLRGYKAESFFAVAEFYARQRKWVSAALYYRRIIDQYSDTSWAGQAVAKLTALEQAGRIDKNA